MVLKIGLHALKDEVIARMPLRIIGSGWAMDAGGNARGANSIDLQITRAYDDQVCSAPNSVILGGSNNKNCSIYDNSILVGGLNNTLGFYSKNSFIGAGSYNTIDSENSIIVGGAHNYIPTGKARATIVGGSYNQVSSAGAVVVGGEYNIAGNYSFVGGGLYNHAYGQWSAIISGYFGLTDKPGQQTFSTGKFAAQGDAQRSGLIARIATTDNTPTDLSLLGDLGMVYCTIAQDTTWEFEIHVVARRTDADSESAGYMFNGVIDNNAGTTALVGSVTKTVIAEDTAAWDCNVTADDTNDALLITVTGENSKTIQWVASIDLVETTG